MPQPKNSLNDLITIPDKITLEDLTKLLYTYIAEGRERDAERKQRDAERDAAAKERDAERKQRDAERDAAAKERDAERNAAAKEQQAIWNKQQADWREQQADWDRRQANWEKRWAAFEKQAKRTDKQLGDLHNKFGRMEEAHVIPSVVRLLNALGYDMKERATYRNYVLEDEKNQTQTEVDAVIDNCATTALVEVKTSAVKITDIEHHIRRMQIYRANCERKGIPVRDLIGIVAGVEFAADAKQAAIDAGFFVVVPAGRHVKFDVPEGFKAKLY